MIILAKSQVFDFKSITYEVKFNLKLIIKFVLKHFIYLKF